MPGNETSLVLAYILYLACPCCNTCQPLMFAIKLWFHCAAWISSYQPHAYIVSTGSWLHTTGSSQQIHQEGSLQLQLGFGFPHKEPRILRYQFLREDLLERLSPPNSKQLRMLETPMCGDYFSRCHRPSSYRSPILNR